MYLTYNEYREYGGTLDETAFNDISLEAESYIDWYTFNRLWGEDTIPSRVKKCMYQIINLIDMQMKLLTAPLSEMSQESSSSVTPQIMSMSNDGVSIAYNAISAQEALESCKTKVDNAIKHYLQGITNSLGRKLLYRGIYPDE